MPAAESPARQIIHPASPCGFSAASPITGRSLAPSDVMDMSPARSTASVENNALWHGEPSPAAAAAVAAGLFSSPPVVHPGVAKAAQATPPSPVVAVAYCIASPAVPQFQQQQLQQQQVQARRRRCSTGSMPPLATACEAPLEDVSVRRRRRDSIPSAIAGSPGRATDRSRRASLGHAAAAAAAAGGRASILGGTSRSRRLSNQQYLVALAGLGSDGSGSYHSPLSGDSLSSFGSLAECFALGGDSEDEANADDGYSDLDQSFVPRTAEKFDIAMDESFEDGECDRDDDLEAQFAFDAEVVANGLREGANREELAAIIEGAMVCNLEEQLEAVDEEFSDSESSSSFRAAGLSFNGCTPGSQGNQSSLRMSPDRLNHSSLRMSPGRLQGFSPCMTPERRSPERRSLEGTTAELNDLSGIMTPPRAGSEGDAAPIEHSPPSRDRCAVQLDCSARMTPTPRAGGVSAVRCSLASSPVRMRRMSTTALQHPQICGAVRRASTQFLARRRSCIGQSPLCEVNGRNENDDSAANVSKPLVQRRRHSTANAGRVYAVRRMSLMKSAEVLEAAGIGTGCDQEKISHVGIPKLDLVDDKLLLVQQAMDDARRSHRRSIAEAVNKASGKTQSGARSKNISQERVDEIIAKALARQGSERCKGGQRVRGSAGMDERGLRALFWAAHSVHCGPCGVLSTEPCKQLTAETTSLQSNCKGKAGLGGHLKPNVMLRRLASKL